MARPMALNTAVEPERSSAFAAQRGEVKERLTLLGMSTRVAEVWLAVWEGTSNMTAERHSSDFWERGGRWAADAWAAGLAAPTIEQ